MWVISLGFQVNTTLSFNLCCIASSLFLTARPWNDKKIEKIQLVQPVFIFRERLQIQVQQFKTFVEKVKTRKLLDSESRNGSFEIATVGWYSSLQIVGADVGREADKTDTIGESESLQVYKTGGRAPPPHPSSYVAN